MTITVGVTGGTGFIGRNLIHQLVESGCRVISLQRSTTQTNSHETRFFDLETTTSLKSDVLSDIDVLIHTAALVHQNTLSADEYVLKNTQATVSLYKLARAAQVKKFFFISSVSVYGVYSSDIIITAESPTNAQTAYGASKLNAEKFLLDQGTSPSVAVFRLPLVHGPDAPGNIKQLRRAIRKRIPIPISSVTNKRSMLSVDNLCRILVSATKDENNTPVLHLLADKTPISTEQLIRKTASDLGLHPIYFRCPRIFLKCIFRILRKDEIYTKLYEDLVFESTIEPANHI